MNRKIFGRHEIRISTYPYSLAVSSFLLVFDPGLIGRANFKNP